MYRKHLRDIKKNPKLKLHELVRYIRQPHIDYELEGEVTKKNDGTVIFDVKQKSEMAPNTRQFIEHLTVCNINFHTHPRYEIWPSIEDIMLVMYGRLQVSVIITRMGNWIMKNNGYPLNNYSINDQKKITKAIYNEYNNEVVQMMIHSYSKWKYNEEKNMLNIRQTFYIMEENVLQTIRTFSDRLKNIIQIKFYTIQESEEFMFELKNLMKKTELKCNK